MGIQRGRDKRREWVFGVSKIERWKEGWGEGRGQAGRRGGRGQGGKGDGKVIGERAGGKGNRVWGEERKIYPSTVQTPSFLYTLGGGRCDIIAAPAVWRIAKGCVVENGCQILIEYSVPRK